jgi:HK97 family phage portal protein
MISTLAQPAKWLIDLFSGTQKGDVKVNEESMLGSAAIWYAITTIAGDVSKMPLEPRRMLADGRGSDPAFDHNAYRLLIDEPNQFQTSDVFKEQIQGHALAWGNGRAAIVREGGQVVELLPLMPDRTITVMYRGEKYHATWPTIDDPIGLQEAIRNNPEEPSLPSGALILRDVDVLHITGFGYDGIEGKGIAKVARDSFGCDLRAQRYTNDQMKRGFAGKLMLQAPPGLFRDEDDAKAFLSGFRERHELGKDGETVGLLREGITANVMAMSNVDAQFIEQRRFSRQDVMLWFGLQHIPGDNSSVSYNSLEQKMLAYLASCLDRWLVRWEMQCDAKLRTVAEKRARSIYFKFDRPSWLQMDFSSMVNALTRLVHYEVLSSNDAREMLHMNPRPGGDSYSNPNSANAVRQENNEPQDKFESFYENEHKRLIDIANGKANVQDAMKSIEAFYSRWKVTVAASVGQDDADQYVQARLEEISAIILVCQDYEQFKKAIINFDMKGQSDV